MQTRIQASLAKSIELSPLDRRRLRHHRQERRSKHNIDRRDRQWMNAQSTQNIQRQTRFDIHSRVECIDKQTTTSPTTATMPDQLTNKRIASTDHSRPHTKHTYKHARSYGKLLHTDDGRTNGQTSVISIVAGYAEAIHKIPTKHALKKGRRQRRQ